MRKFIGSVAAVVALGSSLSFAGATQAVAAPQEPAAQADRAGCVKMLDRYNQGMNRYIKVKNSCSRKACFSVTVAARRDPEFSIGANKTQSFRYGGALWTKATGIKNISC
ncbi:hypothetical protein [Streptomyces sp. RK62]|uniref:hypothetical protein n=1 Tax=Streptomyces sp. RK62 TaxID=2824893 RepID=UPI001B362A3E|nr:hypothetical protein [Streptomyces sp. RK62]MBQ0995909.1 hypothetical protein [Streptomyces sp. RK62]